MGIEQIPILKRLIVSYQPDESDRAFVERSQTQSRDGIEVSLAVLDGAESRRFFGVPMARRGIQPVWIRIKNGGVDPVRLHLVGIDPNYFSSYEAAAANHYSTGKRLLGFGMVAWFFLPILLFLPLKVITAIRANRLMDAFFQKHAFRLRPIEPGKEASGFVYTPIDAGTKVIHVRLLGSSKIEEFLFTVTIPGLKADYLRLGTADRYKPDELIECDIPALREKLAAAPRAVSNKIGSKEGDPVNLVVVGEFETLLSGFGARWDETETITLSTCWKTAKAFLLGAEYRYSPVSALYLYGRSQDFALQRIRESVNERLHLRLWQTPLRLQGRPVWIGQISRDIGVRFTLKTWNLTTHRIDPDVDEARDYVVEDLLEAERLEMAGYVDGVGACDVGSPRHNLTGDYYFTDGKRAAVVVSPSRAAPQLISLG